LHMAAISHAPNACAHLLAFEGGKAAALVENKAKQTALHLAAALGREEAVQELLDAERMAASVQDKSGRTPGQWAAFAGFRVGLLWFVVLISSVPRATKT